MFSLVIFDLDGTLVDTAPGLAAALNAALADIGLDSVTEAQVRRWIGNGTRELVRRAYEHASVARAGEAPGFLLQAFERHYAANAGRASRLFPGITEGLQALRKLGVAIALVTNKEERFTSALLHFHRLWCWFDAVLCGDTLERKKPDPMQVEYCLALFSIPAARTLFVGDSAIDVATARNAGVPVWAVSYGYHCDKLLGEALPDRVIPTIHAVAEAIAPTLPA